MARILCVWELGSDLGHLSHLRLPIEVALQLGHEVYLAARQLDRIPEVLGHMPVQCLQAPFKQNVLSADQAAFPSYTHLIARQCFSGADELEMYLRAWRSIFDLVRPDLVLFEHSPTALIAARGYGFKKVLVGNGFSIPPKSAASSDPFAPFVTRPQTAEIWAGLRSDDAVLMQVINMALSRLGVPGLPSLSDIYAQADEQFMMTLPLLDHFGERPGQRYLGIEPPGALQAPQWPSGAGPKVFGYLHAFASLERLLRDLKAAKVCALLHVRDLPPALKEAYAGEGMHFTDQLIDLLKVAEQADWVINHGNHGTAACFLRAGLPQLLIPRHQEHLFVSLRLVAQGCAVMAYQDQSGFSAEIATMAVSQLIRQRAIQAQAQCPSLESLDRAGIVQQTFRVLLPDSLETNQERRMMDQITEQGQSLRLDLGCGKKKKQGFIGVDSLSFDGVDLVFNLKNEKWPWSDGSVQEVYSRHLLEHLTGSERISFFNELYRVMAAGATAWLVTPHWSHESAYGDPTHEWPPVTSWTYNYLNKAWREACAPHVGYTCDFDCTLTFSHDADDKWVSSRDEQTKNLLMTRNINTAIELMARLSKR